MDDPHRDWERLYQEKSTPWDVGKAEDSLVGLVNKGIIKPCRALEIGCGNGNDSVFLAKSGFDVTAVDISKTAIKTAKERMKKAKVKISFLEGDITELKNLNEKFQFVYDRACFHFIPKGRMTGYIETVNSLLETGGMFVLIASSDVDNVKGPHQFSKEDIKRLFEKDFDIREIKLITLEQHMEKPTPYFCLMKKK